MSSSKCIDLWLRNVPRRTHALTRYGRLAAAAPLSTTSSACSGRGPAYVQQPDKTHPTVVESVQPAAVSQVALNRHSKAAERLRMPKSTKPQEAEFDDSMEGKLKQMDQLRAMQRVQQFDMWSQPMDLLDLQLTSWKSPKKDASLLDHVSAISEKFVNWMKNAQVMWYIAKDNSFPDVDVKTRWSINLFKVKSTPWLAPVRQLALQTYKDVNTAIAAGDIKTVKKLTASEFETHSMKLIRAQNPSHVYVWDFVKEETPCTVVSIRAVPAHLGIEPPRFGNRLLIQALVKFDTLQTLKVYNKKGDLVRDEKPRRVVQYLVFQKRMWYNTPWIIRNEFFENMDIEFTSP